MKAVVAHGALLAAALVAALATWTGGGRETGGEATVVVWDRSPRDLAGLLYRSGERTLALERRGSGADAHLWATETTAAAAPAADEPAGGAAEPEDAATTEDPAAVDTPVAAVEEFPVGDAGATLFERFAALRATRDLGSADADRREAYGLLEEEPRVVARFADGSERSLVLGDAVPGGGARYALDADGQRIYVVPTGLVSPLEGGASTLRLTRYHAFQPGDVATVTVRAGTVERTMRRRTVESPNRTVWTPPDSDRADAAFAGFMEQIERIWVTRFASDGPTEGLDPLVRLEYADGRGRPLGFLEMHVVRDADGAPTYYVRTPRTVVAGEVYGPTGERIEQDVEAVLGQGAFTP